MIATCRRIGWKSSDGRHFLDDLGQLYDVGMDSPLAVAAAAARSVKKWCLGQVITELRSAAPPGASVNVMPEPGVTPERILVELSASLKPLFRGTKAVRKKQPSWQQKYGPYLKSAACGGAMAASAQGEAAQLAARQSVSAVQV